MHPNGNQSLEIRFFFLFVHKKKKIKKKVTLAQTWSSKAQMLNMEPKTQITLHPSDWPTRAPNKDKTLEDSGDLQVL
jgi:hypothetical protein